MTDRPHGEGKLLTPDRIAAIDRLFARLPSETPDRFKAALAIREAFLERLADVMQPSINAFAAEQSSDTLEERRDLATTINSMLRRLSLSIRCPKTGQPGLLVADRISPERPDELRFRINVIEDNGKSKFTVTSKQLPDLELMVCPTRREALRRGYEPRGR